MASRQNSQRAHRIRAVSAGFRHDPDPSPAIRFERVYNAPSIDPNIPGSPLTVEGRHHASGGAALPAPISDCWSFPTSGTLATAESIA